MKREGERVRGRESEAESRSEPARESQKTKKEQVRVL
jgi:hypothetical protein